jgi:hypothetical protein
LIMTSTDHTAGARPSVRNEPKSQSFRYTDLQLYPLSPAQVKQLTDEQRLAGTLFAVTVIEGLLEYSEAYKRHFRGKQDPISPWPLTPSQASGLHAALYYLQQYTGTLHPEPGG